MDRSLGFGRRRLHRTTTGLADLVRCLVELAERHKLLWHVTTRHLRARQKESRSMDLVERVAGGAVLIDSDYLVEEGAPGW